MAATITSIIGLQNLINLQEFRADYNSLTAIDFSNLTNLTYIDISDNDIPGTGTPSLTSVNLTGCTALQELRLDDSDFSAGIPDLTGLTDLFWIDMDECDISGDLDLSMLPALIGFDLSNNSEITSVNLPEASLDDIDLDDTALTEIAVNNILQWVDGSGVTNGYMDLSGGTSAGPTGAGITAKDSLISKGWEVRVNAPSLPFDITADWSLTTPAVVDEASFRTFLESGENGDGYNNNLIDVVITDFSLVGNRLTCNLSANGNGQELNLTYMDVTSVISLGNITGTLQVIRLRNNNDLTSVDGVVWPSADKISLGDNAITSFDNIIWPSGLLELELYGNLLTSYNPTLPLPSSLQYLALGENQIVTFNPTIALPSGLTSLNLGSNQIVNFDPTIALPDNLSMLDLSNNQMTTAGYTGSEPWANAMSVIPGRGAIYFNDNVNSISGTNLETILIAKGWNVAV